MGCYCKIGFYYKYKVTIEVDSSGKPISNIPDIRNKFYSECNRLKGNEGTFELGHTFGVPDGDYVPEASNAIELIMDTQLQTNDAQNLYRQGSIGYWGPNANVSYNGVTYVSTANTQHWSQAFSNIEVLDYNVVTESKK